jgi:hypothetical protein
MGEVGRARSKLNASTREYDDVAAEYVHVANITIRKPTLPRTWNA